MYTINELGTSLDSTDSRNSFRCSVRKLQRRSTGSGVPSTRLDLCPRVDRVVPPHGPRGRPVPVGPDGILGPAGAQPRVVTGVCPIQKPSTCIVHHRGPLGIHRIDNRPDGGPWPALVSVPCVGVVRDIFECEGGLKNMSSAHVPEPPP